MAQRSGWKIALIIVGIVLVLGFLVCGVSILWGYLTLQENLPEMREAGERAQGAAQEFAATHTQQECIDEGFRRHDACGTGMAIMCRTETRIFLENCLRVATPTAGICDGVPAPTEIMRSANWAVQYCRDHDHGNDQQCGNFVGGITAYCGRPQ